MSKHRNTYMALGAAVVGYLGLRALGRKGAKRQPTFVLPGQTAELYMGTMTTVRLPRGTYEVLGHDGLVTPLAQQHVGTHTNVPIQVGASPGPGYTVRPTFVDVDDPQRSFQITLVVRRYKGG